MQKETQLDAPTSLQTTGQLRSLLAQAAVSVVNGSMDVEKASLLNKLSKNISDSLYSETKIAMFRKDAGIAPTPFGKLRIGE